MTTLDHHQNSKKLSKRSMLSLLFGLFIATSLFAQENASGRIPVYEVPYEYPNVESIKDALTRVRTYYDRPAHARSPIRKQDRLLPIYQKSTPTPLFQMALPVAGAILTG